MDSYQRGRSPSAGVSQHIRRSASPSPNPAFTSQANALGNDPSLFNPANTNPLADSLTSQQDYQQYFAQAQYPNSADSSFPAQNLDQSAFSFQDSGDQGQQDLASQYTSQSTTDPTFGALGDPQAQFGDISNEALNQDFDSSIYLDFDQPQDSTNDSANLFANMSTTHQQPPDPAHLLQPDMPSAQSSPSFYQDPYNSIPHSRPSSLSPSSAAFIQGNGGEYSGMSFQGHRRLPSDQVSDVSSNHASPYFTNRDSFDGQTSPMLNGNQDPSVLDPHNLGLDRFALSDHRISPGQSSHPSPNLSPQQSMPPLFSPDSLGMLGMDEQFNTLQAQDSFASQEPFPPLQQNESLQDIGQANQMSPPEITFDPAPPSKQPSFNEANPQEWPGGALSPSDGIPNRNRQRARSDPHFNSAASSSRNNSPARPRSPSDGGLRPSDSLAVHSRSRSSSPSGPPGGVQKSYRRSSSPAGVSVAERSAILERAQSPQPSSTNENRASSPTPSVHSNYSNDGGLATGPKRAQKHPATFQCHLCPKRFTRAYNLRSHLRTHTDERPFVCTVCGKAFARQHDRKRHEGLHSGEKKFVCRGTLSTPGAGAWGCGRQFARADALGRHFRSEAGRSCIKPLLDEENKNLNIARGQAADQGLPDGAAASSSSSNPQMMPVQQSTAMSGGSSDFNGMVLPAVLLQQYPALAGMSWDAPPSSSSTNNMGGDFDGSDYGGASDYGELEAFDEEDAGYKSDAGYGGMLDPSFAQAGTSWAIGGGGNAGAGSNGYYSDKGGQ